MISNANVSTQIALSTIHDVFIYNACRDSNILYFAFSKNFCVFRNPCESSLVMVSVHVDVYILKLVVVMIPDEPIPTVVNMI